MLSIGCVQSWGEALRRERRTKRSTGRRSTARGFGPSACAPLTRLILLSLLAAHASAEPSGRIRICDELLVTLSSDRVIQHHATVAPSGLVEVPGIGAIAVAGVTPQALATSIEAQLRDGEQSTLASVSIVRSDDPSCALVDLPPAHLPEKQPVPSGEAVGVEAKPEIELLLPDEFVAQDPPE
jgi:hypothetical protein